MESDTVSETQPLTSLSSYSRSLRRSLTGHGVCLLPGCVWLLFKPVLAMIFINAVVGASNATMMLAALECSYPTKSVFIIMVCVCLFAAFISLFSPVSGFLADVRCGRHRVIFVSVCLMFTASLAVSSIAVFTLARIWLVNVRVYYHIVQPIMFVLAAIGLVLFMSGLTGYQANFIQFGLDQLLEAPSSSLALFIHWTVWAESLGALVVQILDALCWCYHKDMLIVYL